MNTIPDTFRKKATLFFLLFKPEVAKKILFIRGLALKLSLVVLACLTTETATADYMRSIGEIRSDKSVVLYKKKFWPRFSDESSVVKIGTKVLNGHLYIYRRGARGPSSCYMEVIEAMNSKGKPFRVQALDNQYLQLDNQYPQLIYVRADSVVRIVSCADTGCDLINQIIQPRSAVPVTAACDITDNKSMRCACHIKKDKHHKSIAMPTGLNLCKSTSTETGEQARSWFDIHYFN